MKCRSNPYAMLIDNKVVQAQSIIEWGEWFAKADRVIEKTYVDQIIVSTVFLALDHGWAGPRPLWFETIIFNLPNGEEYVDRYETIEEAKEGHQRAVEFAKAVRRES